MQVLNPGYTPCRFQARYFYMKVGVHVNSANTPPIWLTNGVKPVELTVPIHFSQEAFDESSGGTNVSPTTRRFQLSKYITPTLGVNPAQGQVDASGNPDLSQQIYYFEGMFDLGLIVEQGDFFNPPQAQDIFPNDQVVSSAFLVVGDPIDS